MMDWLAHHGSELVLVVFFITFLLFAAWAYVPSNRKKMDDCGKIPLKENYDGEQ